MLYSPKSIANCFLDLAKASEQSISPMKLQKLVYYAHGWYAGYTGQPLINEEIEAWRYGPVIPSLYHEFKRFGAGDITVKATEFDGAQFEEVPPPEDPSIRKFIANIWNSYGQFTGIRLSEMTHAADSPWHQTRKAAPGMHGADIPNQLIAAHFKAAINRAKSQSVPV